MYTYLYTNIYTYLYMPIYILVIYIIYFFTILEQAIQSSENGENNTNNRGINNRDLQFSYPNSDMEKVKPLSPTLQNKVFI
jgi:hypothetical protein